MDCDRPENLASVLNEIKTWFTSVLSEFTSLEAHCKDAQGNSTQESCVVCRQDLNQLGKQLTKLSRHISKVDIRHIHHLQDRITLLEQEVVYKQREMERLSLDCEHLRTRFNTTLLEAQQDREEKFGLQREVERTSEAVAQQTAYCAVLGAASCGLLWRACRREESVEAVLAASKIGDFLLLVSNTVETYLTTYSYDVPEEKNDEHQFILALCGTMANIAASASGREWLMATDHGRQVVETFIRVLGRRPTPHCASIVNLILVALYNVAINEKGLKRLTSQPDIMDILGWILKENVGAVRLQCLRLIQSLIYERHSPELLSEAKDMLTPEVIQTLTSDRSSGVHKAVLELMEDLQTVSTEP